MSAQVVVANLIIRLRTFSRQKYAMFFTFAFPVILILVFGVIFAMPERVPLELHVQDRDASSASRQLVERLAGNGAFRVTHIPREVDGAAHARQHGLTFVLIIPENFEARHNPMLAVSDDEVVEFKYIYDPSVIAIADRDEFLHAMLLEVNQRLFETLPFIRPDDAPAMRRGNRFLNFFVPGIIAMAVMTASLYGALHINAELRQKGIIRKLAATPITRGEWLLSNVLYQLVLAVISTALILIVSYIAFGVQLWINVWLPVYITLAVFTFVGLGMILTPIAKDAESASAAGNAILFPMMFLSGTFFPVALMPEVLQAVAYALPLYYINEGLRAGMVFTEHGVAVMYAGITALFAVATFVAGALSSNWNEGT